MKRMWLALGLALGLIGTAGAGEASQLYGELYRQSGLEAQLEQAPALILHNFRQEAAGLRDRGLPAEALEEIGREIRKAFSPSVMKAVIIAHLRGNLAAADARDSLAWARTSLGQKIARLDEYTSTIEGQAALEQFAAALDRSTMSKEQVALIQRLVDEAHVVEMVIDIAVSMQKGVAAAALAASAQDNLSSLPQVFAQIDQRRDELRGYYEKTVLLSSLFTYQSLTEDELRRYLEFVNSPHGARYHEAMFVAMRNAVTQAALRLGSSLGKVLNTARSRKTL